MSKLTERSERLEQIKLEKRVQHLTAQRAKLLREMKDNVKVKS